jgi:hypothetical protein
MVDIHVVSTTHGTSDWRVEKADGTYLCDVRLELSASFYGSRYYVLDGGQLKREGTFTFDVWDDGAAREVLTAIVKKWLAPDATVVVERQPQRRAMGA